MRWLLSVCAALLVCAGVVRGGDGFFDMEEDPARLVDAALEGEGLAIFLVVEPGCEACDITRNAFDEYHYVGMQGHKDEFAQRAIVDRSIDPVSSVKLGVAIAPTVVLVRGGEVIGRARGDFESFDLERWYETMIGPVEEPAAPEFDDVENEHARAMLDEVFDPAQPQNRFKQHMERHELAEASEALLSLLELHEPGQMWFPAMLMCAPFRHEDIVRIVRWQPEVGDRIEVVMERAREAVIAPSDAPLAFDTALQVYIALALARGDDDSIRASLSATDLYLREAIEDKLLAFDAVGLALAEYDTIEEFLANRMRLRIADLSRHPLASAAEKASMIGLVAEDGVTLFGALMEHEREAEALQAADWLLGRFTDPFLRLDLLLEVPYGAEPREWMRDWIAMVKPSLPPARTDGEGDDRASPRGRFRRAEQLVEDLFN